MARKTRRAKHEAVEIGSSQAKPARSLPPITSAQARAQLEPYCSEFLCTYIDAEGELQGTNLAWFRSLHSTTHLPITAAGGVTTEEEINALEEMGMNAALGMAIYQKLFPEPFKKQAGRSKSL
jgi:phosphoribosylformimino-5-aminoimidazole carboxamide ribonucleotide (ProFAR) isomerase